MARQRRPRLPGARVERAAAGPLIGVVGPCGSGKSALVAELRARQYNAREIAQEHSYVQDMWRRFTNPDLLIYLDVSLETAQRRQGRTLPAEWWREILDRLVHARDHADLVVDTDQRTSDAVLEQVLDLLNAVVGGKEVRQT